VASRPIRPAEGRATARERALADAGTGRLKGTAQVAVEISFKGFWAVSLALKVVSSDLRRAQGSRRSYGYEKAV
jgi:hypothetical protein